MQKSHEEAVEESRDVLLRAIGEPEDLTFIRLYGNIGDDLIYAGTRQLLARRFYKEVSVRNLGGVSGHTALVAGCGGWCGPYHDMVEHLPAIEAKFERVIIMPSSFDVSVRSVRSTLAATKALVFAREGNDIAVGFTFAAMAGSFLVSYARAKAELLGLKGDVGLGSRAERVVVITAGLVFAPWGGLQWAIYFLAVTAWFTVLQRVFSVRSQLRRK